MVTAILTKSVMSSTWPACGRNIDRITIGVAHYLCLQTNCMFTWYQTIFFKFWLYLSFIFLHCYLCVFKQLILIHVQCCTTLVAGRQHNFSGQSLADLMVELLLNFKCLKTKLNKLILIEFRFHSSDFVFES